MVLTREATKLREGRQAFSEKCCIRISGKPSKTEMIRGYNRIHRLWGGGDIIEYVIHGKAENCYRLLVHLGTSEGQKFLLHPPAGLGVPTASEVQLIVNE